MRLRTRLLLLVTPFVLLPLVSGLLIYNGISRKNLYTVRSRLLAVEAESFVQSLNQELDVLERLGLIDTPFYVNRTLQQLRQRYMSPENETLMFLANREGRVLIGPDGAVPVVPEAYWTADGETVNIKDATLLSEPGHYLIQSLTVERNGWRLLVAVPRSSVYGALDAATGVTILITGVFLLAATALLFYLSSRFTAPLVKLTGTVVQMGREDGHIPEGSQDGDEIRILSREFSLMADRLESSRVELEDRVADRTRELSDSLVELRTTQERLIESEKMAALGSLVAGISHEINTPLGVAITAITYLNQLADKRAGGMGRDADQDERYFVEQTAEVSTIVHRNLERAGKLVLNFKQIAVDQAYEEPRFVNVREFLDDVTMNLGPKLKEARVSVEADGPEDVSMFTFPGAMWQVFSNLIMNCLFHAYPDGVGGTVVIRWTEDDGAVTFAVSDTGAGIPEENLSKIFEPFFTTRRHAGGTGLGLNIVYNTVNQLLEGSIRVNSKVGEGTEFVLSVPKIATRKKPKSTDVD